MLLQASETNALKTHPPPLIPQKSDVNDASSATELKLVSRNIEATAQGMRF